MVALQRTNEKIYNANIVKNTQSIIMVGQYDDATRSFRGLNPKVWWRDDLKRLNPKFHFTKYQIKETDMRIKTATFSSPNYIDLTTGLYFVLITSPYHEDFAGVILKVKENEDTKEYDYQCQDFSRLYQSKMRSYTYTYKNYEIIRNVLTYGEVPLKPTAKQLDKYKYVLSGLRPAHWYDQSLWGSTVKFNPMSDVTKHLVLGVSHIDYIRALMFGSGAYVDVYFNKYGVLQIEPYHKDDWLRTGLHLYPHELASRTPEFDTTNVITGVRVENTDKTKKSSIYTSEDILNLDLTAFFGLVGGYIKNPNEAKTTTTTTTTAKKTSTTGNKDNPYGNKKKKVWIDADSGSCGTRTALANALRKKGWGVHVGGCGPNYHYSDYFRVSSDYQCLITIYNGFCAGTIREAYSSYIQNTLKKKGVVLIPCFITNTWTNPRGMAPYKYGDFSGYHARRAWDDNFSGSDPSISNVGTFFKNNNAKYLCYPNINGLVTQFLAGGYFEWKKKGGR